MRARMAPARPEWDVTIRLAGRDVPTLRPEEAGSRDTRGPGVLARLWAWLAGEPIGLTRRELVRTISAAVRPEYRRLVREASAGELAIAVGLYIEAGRVYGERILEQARREIEPEAAGRTAAMRHAPSPAPAMAGRPAPGGARHVFTGWQPLRAGEIPAALAGLNDPSSGVRTAGGGR